LSLSEYGSRDEIEKSTQSYNPDLNTQIMFGELMNEYIKKETTFNRILIIFIIPEYQVSSFFFLFDDYLASTNTYFE